MKWILIRYQTRPEKTEENAARVRAVFEELKAKAPPGLRYMVMGLPDGGFVHFVSAPEGANPLFSMDAFRAFQDGVRERQAGPVDRQEVEILGDYRVLGD